jgi:hypothetical protein
LLGRRALDGGVGAEPGPDGHRAVKIGPAQASWTPVAAEGGMSVAGVMPCIFFVTQDRFRRDLSEQKMGGGR